MISVENANTVYIMLTGTEGNIQNYNAGIHIYLDMISTT